MTVRRFFRDIFPVICWLGVIFFLSTDNGSAEHTNSFLDEHLRLWFGGVIAHLTADQLDTLHYCVRKAAHLTEYLILAVLLVRAIARGRAGARPPRAAVLAWCFATVYAMTDEFHQRFVSSRTPKVTDVMIDSVGALLGVALVASILFLRRKAQARKFAAALGG
ncbi:teicoplanin resistance protein VanZ [Capsulimonas corticalis]|uniref:Teicoplanin resistance protein VanZ n=1 Tax=Capsulimonas corticalis TaxID=2219043 RepID=A0A402CYH2_9BACT|nr:VanZ family protein [Capsulimonas corticalis]BDI31377.1 teicoplanin resistance protein VanZ [Capsulimonas corticalis]